MIKNHNLQFNQINNIWFKIKNTSKLKQNMQKSHARCIEVIYADVVAT